jgi:hypothetical protein
MDIGLNNKTPKERNKVPESPKPKAQGGHSKRERGVRWESERKEHIRDMTM